MIPFHRDLLAEGRGCGEDFHGCFGAQSLSSAVVSALALPVTLTSEQSTYTYLPSILYLITHVLCWHLFVKGHLRQNDRIG